MRPWHWQEVYCLQNYQQRCVPDTRILRRASLAQLSVCERPHVCTLPPLLTSARYPWINNLSISIVSYCFRVVVMYVCTWNVAMPAAYCTSNSSNTNRVDSSKLTTVIIDISFRKSFSYYETHLLSCLPRSIIDLIELNCPCYYL